MSRVKERGRGLELRLRPRRVKIKPEEKRHEYIRRIDKAIETLEAIINSDKADKKTRYRRPTPSHASSAPPTSWSMTSTSRA